jgi:hypothetical protein
MSASPLAGEALGFPGIIAALAHPERAWRQFVIKNSRNQLTHRLRLQEKTIEKMRQQTTGNAMLSGMRNAENYISWQKHCHRHRH